MTQEIIIKDWQYGVADSPHLGIGMIRNADIEAFPGALKVQKKLTSMFPTAVSVTVTVNPTTNVFTMATGTANAAMAVTFSSTGTLPAGITAGTVYFLTQTSSNTFELAASMTLTPSIDITDAGTGVHTMTSVPIGTIKHIIEDKRTDTYFASDSNGRIWYAPSGVTFYLLNGNTRTNGEGNGIALLRTSDGNATYLFVFRNATIDVINVFGTSNLETPVWTTAWKSLNSGAGAGNSHHAINAQDGIIYFCDDRYIGSIKENSGSVFDPATAGTYTFNNQALDTPQGEVLNWLSELGTNLLAAGNTWNKIYPWDRVSDSFSLPIDVPENIVKRMQNIGGIVYILAGTKGNVYTTQGTYARHFKKIPDYLINNSGTLQTAVVTWGGIAQRDGALLIGVGGLTSGNSGVYLLYPDGRLIQDNIPSTGSAAVSAIYAENDFYKIGYVGGADYSNTSRYSSYETVIHSALYKVGNKTQKGTFSTLEAQVAKPASTGHMRIKYRTNTSSAFADFPGATIVFTADGTTTSFEADIGLIDIENVQTQIEMDGDFELMEIRLVP